MTIRRRALGLTAVAVAAAAVVALRGRSMTLVVLAGGAVYAVLWMGLAVLG